MSCCGQSAEIAPCNSLVKFVWLAMLGAPRREEKPPPQERIDTSMRYQKIAFLLNGPH